MLQQYALIYHLSQTSIIVLCGLAGSGKSSIISRMLKNNNLKFTSTSFSNLATLRGIVNFAFIPVNFTFCFFNFVNCHLVSL